MAGKAHSGKPSCEQKGLVFFFQVHIENKNVSLAAALSMELGNALQVVTLLLFSIHVRSYSYYQTFRDSILIPVQISKT